MESGNKKVKLNENSLDLGPYCDIEKESGKKVKQTSLDLDPDFEIEKESVNKK